MKFFVIHHPKLTERKEHVLKRLEDFQVTDVEWVEHLNADSDFIKWIKNWTNSPLAHGHISCTIKYFWVFDQMVKRDIHEAIIIEDDVVFHDSFKDFVPHKDLKFIKLGIGVNWPLAPSAKPTIVGNYGGTEAQYVTIDFANEMLRNFTLDQTIDIVFWAHLYNTRYPLWCVPVCHQTSLLEENGITGGSSDKVMSWRDFIVLWPQIPKTTWQKILDDYERKKSVENEFERLFHKKVTITNSDYIKEKLS